jgi:hypothetical protein
MAKLSAEEPDALMCARPGLWEPWRATARATRPEARCATAHSRIERCDQRALETYSLGLDSPEGGKLIEFRTLDRYFAVIRPEQLRSIQ